MIYREEGSATRRMMEKLMNERNTNSGKRFELSSNEAVKQAILAGLGYSVMPLIGIRNELIRGELKIIKTEGLPIINRWYVIWNKGKQLNPASAAFFSIFRNNRERLVRAHFGWIEDFIPECLWAQQVVKRPANWSLKENSSSTLAKRRFVNGFRYPSIGIAYVIDLVLLRQDLVFRDKKFLVMRYKKALQAPFYFIMCQYYNALQRA
ncbi:MAG: LysR substrate-binding domain-containing protein [Saprospiraceae bacterium]